MNFMSSMLELPGLAAGLALTVKVTLVLAIGAVAAQLLRGRSAAVRHFLWLLTLIGVLGVTAFTAFPRGMKFAVPYWPQAASVGGTALRTGGPVGGPSDAPVRPTIGRDGIRIAEGAGGAESPRPPLAWPSLLAKLWLLGTCLALAWFALGHVALARLSRRAEPVHDPAWRSLLDRLAAESGLPRGLRLRRSGAVGAPLVCGLLRPTILLPAEADSWGPERRRVVVLHELAHVARRDPLAQRIAWLACSLYWFHPAAWMAARRLRAESERACDDRVLSSGVAAPDYASHLLSLARRARAMRLAGSAAIAMARRSTLEGRLLSLLDDGVRRGALTLRARAIGLAALAVAILGLGLARPVARALAFADGETSGPARAEVPASAEADAGSPSFDRGVPAEPGETLVLDLDTGGTVTIRGGDARRVEVHGVLAGRDGRNQAVKLERQGSRVVLSARSTQIGGSSSTSNRFEIRVPRRFQLELSSAGGGVTIVDLEGTLRGRTGGGDLSMERVRGQATLSTGGGDIRVTDCDLSGSVSTGGGMVRLSRVRGGLHGRSGSGPVIYTEGPEGDSSGATGDLGDLELDSSGITIIHGKDSARNPSPGSMPAGMLNVEQAGGAIRLNEAPSGVRAKTGGGDISIGKSNAMVDVSTGGGDIEIGPATGSVRAGTGAGDVHVVLAPGKARRTVDVTSGNGRVVLELPPGLEVDLELETSYTQASRPTRIRSDVPADVAPATDWDDREGTPRRYVRAHSETGSGVQVRVKTVNGDIEVRRTGRSD